MVDVAGRAAALLDGAVRDGIAPAASVVASGPRGRRLEHHAGAGAPGLRYDLASLTKVMHTTAAAMALVADGRLTLDEHDAALLLHESGLPGWRPLHLEAGVGPGALRTAADREAVRALVRSATPTALPGAAAVYSDLGFIRLEERLERALGGPLAPWVAERVLAPLGLSATGFVDLTAAGAPARAAAATPYAPTEDCPWRGRRLVAEVHDENAHAMGGVAGHAGLFGTAGDVHAFGAGLLACLRAEGPGRPLPADVVRRFWTTRGRAPGSTRALGWDTPTPGGSSAGRHVSAAAVGHLGFTGVSLWIDPPAGVVVALLTNRVYFGRADDGIRALRPAVHEAIWEELGAC